MDLTHAFDGRAALSTRHVREALHFVVVVVFFGWESISVAKEHGLSVGALGGHGVVLAQY